MISSTELRLNVRRQLKDQLQQLPAVAQSAADDVIRAVCRTHTEIPFAGDSAGVEKVEHNMADVLQASEDLTACIGVTGIPQPVAAHKAQEFITAVETAYLDVVTRATAHGQKPGNFLN